MTTPKAKLGVYASGPCAYCGRDTGSRELPGHWDHVVPESRGGPSSPFNFVVSCDECNLKKGDQLPSEWLENVPPPVLEIEARIVALYPTFRTVRVRFTDAQWNRLWIVAEAEGITVEEFVGRSTHVELGVDPASLSLRIVKPTRKDTTAEQADRGIPKVPSTATRDPNCGVWQLKILCPYCGKTHTHGGGSGEFPSRYGHRGAHCGTPRPRGYEVGYEVVPGEPVKKSRKESLF